MKKLSNKQNRFLRTQAMSMDPVVQIGKNGLDESVIKSAKDVIKKRELIKVKINQNSPEDRFVAISQLAEELNAELIQIIGRNGILFKQKKKDSHYKLPED